MNSRRSPINISEEDVESMAELLFQSFQMGDYKPKPHLSIRMQLTLLPREHFGYSLNDSLVCLERMEEKHREELAVAGYNH
jgi:hypothetical protein